MTLSKDDELLLNAYLDGELDPLEANRFEARLASEPALAAEIEAYRLLRAALRSDLAEDVPSPDLQRRITSSLDLRAPRPRPAWGALAASFGAYPQPHGNRADRRTIFRPPHGKAVVQRQACFCAGRARLRERRLSARGSEGRCRRARACRHPRLLPRQASYQPHRDTCRSNVRYRGKRL
jgi:anti-sigma factor RsiW